MKYFNLLPMTVIVVLMVVMVGCTTIRDASGEYGDAPSRRRVYYENPYYGNTIILERDPYTGQLYQLSPNGYYSPYDNYGYNNYPQNYNRGYSNRVYSNRSNRGGSTGNTKPSTPRNERSGQEKQKFEDARSKVLGGSRN